MSLQNNLHSESGRSDQIISQFLSKSLHVILEARIPSLSSQGLYREQALVSRARKRDKWFNLAVGDLPTALENLSSWHRNVMDPMIIDVILLHEGVSTSSFDDIYVVPRTIPETVIERWVVQHEFPRTVHASDHQNSYKTYKKSIILLRSLYSTLRLLPAYHIFRKLSSSNQVYSFNVSYRVSSFALPFSRKEEENMKIFTFTPIETSSGRLCVSVTYRSALSDLNLEAPTAFPPQIITDYVGSPAAEPLKVFPSNKNGGAISVPIKTFRGHDYKPLGRPHSWTSGIHKAATIQRHPLSVSPPPMPSDYRSAPFDAYPDKCMSYKLSAYKTGASLDEYRLSPPFSSSPSPSPPTQSSSVHSLKARLRSDSVPVSIPLPIAGRVGSQNLSPISSDPNRSLFPPPSPRSTKCDPCSHDSSSENRSLRRQDTLKSRELHAGNSNLYGLSGNKIFKDAKDDSGRFSGVGSSSDSPRIGFSRSSSRLSFQDDLDDCDFACPFAVDDVDISEVQTRDGKISSESSYSSPVRKSQDAAVGMLVEMLKTAAPLRQDSFSSQSSKSQSGPETVTSGIYPSSRKTEDALKELQIYREMKDFILSQSGTQLLGSVKQRTL